MDGPEHHAPILPFHTPAAVGAEADEPDNTWVTPMANAAGWMTAIGRSWPAGTTYASCRRCPLAFCSLAARHCQVMVNTLVASSDAPTFSLVRFLGPAAGAADDGGAARLGRLGNEG